MDEENIYGELNDTFEEEFEEMFVESADEADDLASFKSKFLCNCFVKDMPRCI